MEQSIPNWLKKRASLTPDRTAIIFEGQHYTFKQIYDSSLKTAAQLADVGVGKGSMAAVLLSNHKDSAIILYALQMIGARTVILNNRLTAKELDWQLEDSRAALLVTEQCFSRQSEEIGQNFKKPIFTKEELFSKPGTEPAIQEEYSLEDVTTIMYTSGTTGRPKGVMQTYGNHWWSATASALNLGLQEEDRWLCAVPLFHISGYSILMRSLIYGMGIVLHSSFDEKKVLEDIGKYKTTIMSVVSTMLQKTVEELGQDELPAFFRCFLLGGGPAPLALLEKCRQKGIPVYQSFGMTETSSQFATLSPEYSLSKLGSAGKALFPNQIMIADEQGNELPCMAEGEILVKGPNVTKGYLHREQETQANIREGWLHTGDIGYIDSQGFLYVLDRRSDLIISGGENIYPAEIEGVLMSHPGIIDAGVVGVEDPAWGQVPAAFIVRREESSVTERDLITFCLERLAKYKVPKSIAFMDELPRNGAKKLLRRKLRESAKADEK
ncbi:o-succinylbenzoate--CoA ligase [Bacillus sp. FJAT-27251]|uniref:o-succinylbenzoate--CoA ligase n=1 Tax=Bacillus sp. FJAT-27251 TaxID=1684142 RepID=UPI0006A7AB9F|nr:o-succinylbenzoate--CoA ligase [Bacillus sp. FJAT-27251]